MALIVGGTTINRVSVNGTFMRTVVQGTTTVFNLSDWAYDGTSGTYTVSLGTYTYGFYTSPSQVPTGQLSSFLGTTYPVQNYGAASRGQVAIFAYIQDPFTFQFNYMFIRYEYYIINQTVGAPAPTYTWVFIEWSDSEPGYADIYMSGPASIDEEMVSAIQAVYPANSYPGYYISFYSTSTGFYNVYYSTT